MSDTNSTSSPGLAPPPLHVNPMDSDDDCAIPLNAGPKRPYPYPIPVFAAAPATGRWLGLIEKLLTLTQPISQQFITQADIKALVSSAIEVLSSEPNYLTLAVDCDESSSSARSRSSSSTVQALPPSTKPLSSFDLVSPPEQPPGKPSLSASAVSAAVNSSPPISILEDLVLVGDIHGQYVDLLTSILSVQGRARAAGTPDKTFLFLGDYVDRGPQSVETLLLLLALKVEYPSQVYLLRGNHEETQTCKTYGFMAECRQKLQLAAWYQFTSVFCELPVAAIIRTPRGSIFACHGGLSPNMMSDPEEVMCFTIRQSYGQGLSGGDDVVDGLLWSDPGAKNGFENNPRGCGFRFGPDASESFCKTNGFDFIVRAHQMVQHGYQWEHQHRVLTVFSAPNYCGINDNLGAICILHSTSQWLDRGLNQPLATDIMTKMPIRVSPLAPQVGRRARSIESLLEFFGFGAAVDNIPVVDPGVRSPVGSSVPLLEDGDLAPPSGQRPVVAVTAASPTLPPPPAPNTDPDAAMMDYFAESSMDQLPDDF